MARNQKHRSGQAVDAMARKTADEMSEAGAEIVTLSTRAAERSVKRFSGMFDLGQEPGEAVQQSARSLKVLQDWGRVLGVGYRDISREYVNWAQNQFQTNWGSLSRLMQCRTVGQLIAVQNQLLGENVALALTVNRRVAEISKDMADRMAEKVTEAGEHPQQAMDRVA
jgi:hypothetical protein